MDASHILDASKYVAILLLALRTMLQLELPHVNVLSKIDLLGQAGDLRAFLSPSSLPPFLPFPLALPEEKKGSDEQDEHTAFNLDYYTEVQDLSYLLPLLERDQRTHKFAEMNRIICEVVEEFGLVGFETLAVEVRFLLLVLARRADADE